MLDPQPRSCRQLMGRNRQGFGSLYPLHSGKIRLVQGARQGDVFATRNSRLSGRMLPSLFERRSSRRLGTTRHSNELRCFCSFITLPLGRSEQLVSM